jgi:tetratricopeptide (TPR) repeat protein
VTLGAWRAPRCWLLLILIVVMGGLGWYGWRRWNAPKPPVIVLGQDDPELAEAIEKARQKIKDSPYSAERWGELGMLLRGVRLPEPARVCFTQAARLDPKNVRWPYLHGESFLPGDPDAALPYLRKAAELWDQPRPEHVAPWLRLGEVLVARGDLEEADRYLQRALEVDSSNPSIHLQLGLLALARNQLEDARRHLLQCQHSPFTRQRAASQLAIISRRLKEPDAESFASSAAKYSVDNDWIDPFVAGCVFLAVGRTVKLSRAQQLEARGQLEEAIRLLTEVTEQSPDHQSFVGLGELLFRVGKLDAAERALRSALRLDAKKVHVHYLLAKIAFVRAEEAEKKKDREQSQAHLRETIDHARTAITYKADHAQAHLLLGRALRKAEQKEEGLKALRTAVRCAPDLADAQAQLKQALTEDGKKE